MSKRRKKNSPRTIEAHIGIRAFTTITVEVPGDATDDQIEEAICQEAESLENDDWNVTVDGTLEIDEWSDV